MVPPEWVIGRSVHGLDEAVRVTAAGRLDYVTYGTVFKTASKPGGRPTGLDALGRVVAALSVPVLAIGGITVERARSVGRTGAAGPGGYRCVRRGGRIDGNVSRARGRDAQRVHHLGHLA